MKKSELQKIIKEELDSYLITENNDMDIKTSFDSYIFEPCKEPIVADVIIRRKDGYTPIMRNYNTSKDEVFKLNPDVRFVTWGPGSSVTVCMYSKKYNEVMTSNWSGMNMRKLTGVEK